MLRVFSGVVLSLLLSFPAFSKGYKESKGSPLLLNSSNSVVFREVFTDASVRTLVHKIFALSKKLNKKATIYLVLDTPGGSVDAGMDLVSALRTIPQEVKTVTIFAASMGFITAQYLGERYITDYGVLMSHRATIGIQGQLPGEADSRLRLFHKMVTKISKDMASRLKLTYGKYMAKIYREYWLIGDEAIEDNAADKLVSIRCDETPKFYKTTTNSFFGSYETAWSECPLIRMPISMKSKGSFRAKNSKNTAKSSIFEILSGDKRTVFEKYIKTGKYKKLLK